MALRSLRMAAMRASFFGVKFAVEVGISLRG
jgi:hypothetical protein